MFLLLFIPNIKHGTALHNYNYKYSTHKVVISEKVVK